MKTILTTIAIDRECGIDNKRKLCSQIRGECGKDLKLSFMPLLSAINGDSVIIPSGSPVTSRNGRSVIRAGIGVTASAIVKSGGASGQLLNILTDGVLDIENWSRVLESGKSKLSPGETYRVSATPGKLRADGTSQVVGIALSKTRLSILISNSTPTTVEESSPGIDPAIAESITQAVAVETEARIVADISLQNQINALADRVAELEKPSYWKELMFGL